MKNAGLEEAQAGIKIAGRNINTSDMQMTPLLWQKVKSLSRVRLFATPMDCRLSGSSFHGILQARVLDWVAIFLLQGIFPTQGSNLGLLHSRQML